MEKERLYEVETRVYFISQEEAFQALPFLKDSLINKVEWETSMHGLELFKTGINLRISSSRVNGTTKHYIGYKEEDMGKFYNIRRELDEEITFGLKDSYILKLLKGSPQEITLENAGRIFESLGYRKFMSSFGNSLTGSYDKLGLELKLLYCSALRYPLLLEIEKTAKTLEEAFEKEQELRNFLKEYNLLKRALKEEPSTLLYETL